MSTVYAQKSTHAKLRIGITIAVVMVLFITTAASAEGETIVTTERLSGTQIGIKILFPNEVSGNFSGFMWGKYFDCKVVSSNVVYCIGPLATWLRAGVFYLYSSESNTNVVIRLISVLPLPHDLIRRPPCPPEECG